MQNLIRPDDLAKMLGVSKGAVYKWARTGVIPHLKIEGVTRFDPDEIEAWLKARQRKGG